MTDSLTETTSNVEILTEKEVILIDDTIDEIKEIWENSAATAYYKTGEIILDKIFKGDHKDAKDICSETSGINKSHLFNGLRDEIVKRSKDDKQEDGLPKKTWLYNSVRLVLDKKYIDENFDIEDMKKYDTLRVSHKIGLLPVSDFDKKKEYVIQIYTDKLSVRKARDLINGSEVIQDSADGKEISLIGFINNPYAEVDINKIPLVGGKKKKDAVQRMDEKISSMKEEIEQKKSSVKKLETLLSLQEKYEPKKGRQKKSK